MQYASMISAYTEGHCRKVSEVGLRVIDLYLSPPPPHTQRKFGSAACALLLRFYARDKGNLF